MKFGFVLAVALLLLVGPLRAEPARSEIAAKVNGVAITTAYLDHEVDASFVGTDLHGDQLQAARREKHTQMLHTLIVRELILQAFRRGGEKVPAGLVDQRLDTIIKEDFGGDRNAFLTTIKARGITVETYRQEIADNWIIGRMREKHPASGWSHSLLAKADVQIY